jgi:hypothetical protein
MVYVRVQIKFCLIFYIFTPYLDKIRQDTSTKMYWVIANFVKIGAVKAIPHPQVWTDFYPYLPHLFTICVQFGTTDQHIMLLSICEYCENRQRELRTYLMGVNKITFTRVPWHRDTLKVKKALVKSVYYVAEHTICNPVKCWRSQTFLFTWKASNTIITRKTILSNETCWPIDQEKDMILTQLAHCKGLHAKST